MTTPDLTDLATRLAEIAADLAAVTKSSGSSLPDSRPPEQGQAVVNATKPSVLLTSGDMRELLQVDARTLRRWRHLGFVPEPVQIGSALRWRRAEIDAWLAKGAKPVRRAVR